MPTLTITADVVGLESEVLQQISQIREKINPALELVGAEMWKCLQKHLQDDWYNGYTPNLYKRRTDMGGAWAAEAITSRNNVTIDVADSKLDFVYEAVGTHPDEQWHTRDGNELIGWIAEKHGDIPARPYWNNFIDDLQGGTLINAFVQGMLPYEIILEGGDKDLTSLDDYKISSEHDSNWTFFDNTEDLPF